MTIYCSGIGGIGLSAYASHMRAAGRSVSGSDRSDSSLINDLRLQGISVTLLQDGSGMSDDIDLFVYSEAIPVDAPERQEATKRNIRQISYFQAVGEMTKGMDLIAVCGTHGKSSTTAMLAQVCIDAGLDPNVIVGTKASALGGRNWRRGNGKLWIVEACEYRRSFHFLSPTTILLTNADGDHFDAFKDAADYRQAFVEFVTKLSPEGKLILHGSDEESVAIALAAHRTFVDADTEALPELRVPGVHMQQNARLVLALSKLRSIAAKSALTSLQNFKGTWRRMELKGTTSSGVTVIDDYAHHPTEIRATLSAMKSAYPRQRIVVVFQPHTHDRTLKLWKEFAVAFTDVDTVLVTSVYDARPDKDTAIADERDLAKAITEGSHTQATFTGNVAGAESKLRSGILEQGDVLVIMGAGDITKLADAMLM